MDRPSDIGSRFRTLHLHGSALSARRCQPRPGDQCRDVVTILGYLFQGQSIGCLQSCDTNDDESNDISDAIALLSFLFGSGVPLPPPYPDCGLDGTPVAPSVAIIPPPAPDFRLLKLSSHLHCPTLLASQDHQPTLASRRRVVIIEREVLIIGAGPTGCVVATLLARHGHQVLLVSDDGREGGLRSRR